MLQEMQDSGLEENAQATEHECRQETQPIEAENNDRYWERLFHKFDLLPDLKYEVTTAVEGKYQLTCSSAGPKVVENINDLPFSLLLNIFSYLSLEDRVLDACFVCKFWHQICFDGSFWQDIDFESRKLITDSILLRSVLYSSNVTNVSLCDCQSNNLTEEGLIEFAKACPQLQVLQLANATKHVTDKVIVAVAENCPKLRHLDLNCVGVTDVALCSLAKHSSCLEHLNINQNGKVTDDGMIPLVKGCPALKELKINMNALITDKTLAAIGERERDSPVMELLIASMNDMTGSGVKHLAPLSALRCLDITKVKNLTVDDVAPLLINIPNMTILCMCMLDQVDDRCVELAVKNCPNLEEFHLTSTSITDQGLILMAAHSKKLVHIEAGYTAVTEKGVQAACEGLPLLQRIGLTRCDKAKDHEIELLAQRYPRIRFGTFLQDTKRMIIRAGHFTENDFGIVTQEVLLEKLSSPHGGVDRSRKRRRKIASGGVFEYI